MSKGAVPNFSTRNKPATTRLNATDPDVVNSNVVNGDDEIVDVEKHHIIQCHECTLKVHVPTLAHRQKAECPRCGFQLTSHHEDADIKVTVYGITALIFLLLSLPFDFISFSAAGITQTISIPSGLLILMQNQYLSLAILESFFIIFVPLLVISSLLTLQFCHHFNITSGLTLRLAKSVFAIMPWSMPEIFLISVLVSLIKIVSMADIQFGLSFYTFCIFVVCNTKMLRYLDEYKIRDRFDAHEHSLHKQQAHHEQQNPSSTDHSVQHTWAFLITAIILYIPANLWPIMETSFLGQSELSTIMAGVVHLWQSGSYPIAAIIFIASVVVPVAKLVILTWLNISIQMGNIKKPEQKTFLYRFTELVGKWSMVDVFVVAILVSLVQLGGAMAILPGPAAIAFSGVVIATMFAANSFNPSLIWKNN